ncbi:KBTB4 protein, partial [Polyodon spathula]|nr:KBTB4 protein [Polyodon spathula]
MHSNDDSGVLNVSGSSEENYFLSYTFTDRTDSGLVVKSIIDLCLEDGLFADVTVSVDRKEFQLHRLVLLAQSCFFRSVFTSNLKEAHNRSIELKDISTPVFQLLVDCIYHGTIKLTVEDLHYEMADMYQLITLFKECSRFLARTIEVRNCLQVMWLLDTAVSGAAGVNLGGTIYLLGGEENDMDFFTKPSRLIQCFDTAAQKCHIKPYMLPFAGCMHATAHKDLIFIVAEGDSLVCYNPLLESFTRLRFPEVWSCTPSFWKVARCNGCIYVFRDKCKKGNANTFKFNPATFVVCYQGDQNPPD